MNDNKIEALLSSDDTDLDNEGAVNKRESLKYIFIQRILRFHSGPGRPLPHSRLLKELNDNIYDLEISETTLSRSLHLLESEGTGVRCGPSGSWYDKEYDRFRTL